jgi:hypothetical protein
VTAQVHRAAALPRRQVALATGMIVAIRVLEGSPADLASFNEILDWQKESSWPTPPDVSASRSSPTAGNELQARTREPNAGI